MMPFNPSSDVYYKCYYAYKDNDFNEKSINCWHDVAGVINIRQMFWFADDFNQPLNDRSVSSVGVVVDNDFCFDYDSKTTNFNQLLSGWNVARVCG